MGSSGGRLVEPGPEVRVGGDDAADDEDRAEHVDPVPRRAVLLLELRVEAREREADPQAWAPYGYKRMLKAMQDKDVAALKTALTTMRPSNLAEPEDLSELLTLLTQAKEVRDKPTELREAIDYADMVVQYVNDGSGTHDLIRKATQQLKQLGIK